MAIRLYSKISQAFWCSRDGEFENAEIPSMKIWDHGPNEVFWLDKLFEGGIFLPDNPKGKKRALTILLTGPPGTGKTTLALELCHRWFDTYRVTESDSGDTLMDKIKLSSLYITSETDKEWAVNKAKFLGWDIEEKQIDQNGKEIIKIKSMPEIWQTNNFKRFIQDEKDTSRFTEIFLGSIAGIFNFNTVINPSPLVNELVDKWHKSNLVSDLQEVGPSVLVFDSLNTVEVSKRAEIFTRFMTLVTSGPRIIVTVLESNESHKENNFWEYLSDIVINLDKEKVSDYLVRTIEIVKARYQSHIWGTHQLKIYAPKRPDNMEVYERRRAHPYRKEGGIFIYPSIHYYLSAFKHLSPETTSIPFIPPIERMKTILRNGFPRGRCTGFIGMRGGHKSHLAYRCILSRVIQNERGLIISLRDDEGMARQTLKKILDRETEYQGSLDDLINDDKIEILYFPPGYVTPEEFFHRVFMSIQRLKKYDQEVTVVFNSLDQLSSRFPLCAREQIFIPGLIATLSGENITSFFIAVQEAGQPPEQYGLLSMADALISFTREKFSKDDYIGHINEELKIKDNSELMQEIANHIPMNHQIVTMRIVRFAGGQAAGAGGLLELIHKDTVKSKIYNSDLKKSDGAVNTGLVFVPFSASYNEGVCIIENFSSLT
jgi:KaiC/GvpD/RAD55 family RecA-like ATPase